MPRSWTDALRGLTAIAGLTAGALLLGTMLAVFILNLQIDGSEWMVEKGPGHFARRCMLLTGLILFPLFIIAIDRFAWKDHGWSSYKGYQLTRPAWTFVPVGIVLGLATLGAVMIFATANGFREWNVAYPPGKMTRKLLIEYPAKALFVGLFEETVVRGWLLRGLTKRMGAVLAIASTSMLFAVLHLMEAPPEAFYGPGFFTEVPRVLAGMMPWNNPDPEAWLIFLNLTMMSVFLCLTVLRTGSIWLAVGVHAGWVWIMLTNGVVADSVKDIPNPWVLGTASNHSDGLLTLFILTTLCVLVWISLRKLVAQSATQEPSKPRRNN